MKQHDIAITGMGIVSPAGNTLESFWDTLCRGESCIRPLTRFDTSDFIFKRGGEVREFSLPDHLAAFAKSEDLAVQYLLGAVDQALSQARLQGERKIAVVAATNFGGSTTAEALYAQVFKGEPAPAGTWGRSRLQRGADAVAEAWQLRGPRQTLSLSCSSGSAALVAGADMIRTGQADVVITAGFDAISRFAWLGLGALRTMTQDDIRPFDINRAGTLFSEGAGVLILENTSRAMARNAQILAYYAGGATNNNAFHITAPAKEGAGSAEVMRAALADAAMVADDIGHVNMHGTGTQANDSTETQAVKTVFGSHVATVPITANKSSLGHMLGAAGSAEAIAAVLTLRHGLIPPTINCLEPDPVCDLDLVRNAPRATGAAAVLSNSAGIGGCNAAVIFQKSCLPARSATMPSASFPAPCRQRVAITGLGPVSPVGIGRNEFFEGLEIGDDGVGAGGLFDDPPCAQMALGAIPDFCLKDYFGKPKGYLDRATQLAFAATVLALADADMQAEEVCGTRSGIVLGTETGCLETAGKFYADFIQKGVRFVKPILFPHTYSNTTISMLAIEYGLRGPHLAYASGLNAGLQAIHAAADQIRLGRADIMLAGGVEGLSREWLAGLQAEGQMAPDGVSAPLDAHCRGLVPGEGAGILVLENYEHARGRGARIYGEIISGRAAPRSDAHFSGADGCPAVDGGELLDLPAGCPVTAIKSMIGECGAAAAGFQVMAGLFAAAAGIMPPTLNVTAPREELGGALVVAMDVACDIQVFSVASCDTSGQTERLIVRIQRMAEL